MLRAMDAGLHQLRAAIAGLPLQPLRDALGDADAWVVGGFVRDVLAGSGAPADIDIAVDGDVDGLVERLGAEAPVAVDARHARFGTATLGVDGLNVDLARTRAETYAHPGALPDVEPAGIEADLARRDFSVNAMAMSLDGEGELLDPFDGRGDLGLREPLPRLDVDRRRQVPGPERTFSVSPAVRPVTCHQSGPPDSPSAKSGAGFGLPPPMSNLIE